MEVSNVEGGNWTFIVQSKRPNPFAVAAAIRPDADTDALTAGVPSVSDEILTGTAAPASFRAAA